MEVVSLLQPYLQQKDPGLLSQIRQRDAAVNALAESLSKLSLQVSS